ncbi:MAG: hypothetical protein HOP33_06230 [Verrucomicrobia bacterium]|nr:hypothetical protein [Verrucomicrobiota bacterium]
MGVAERVKGYLDRIEDINYLVCILDEVPLSDLFKVLVELLGSSDCDDVARVDWFIADVWMRAGRNNAEFKANMVVAGIPAAYQRAVFARNYVIRRTAVSRLRMFEEIWWPAAELADALTFLEKNDPLLLPHVIRVQMWRSLWKDWSLPSRLVEEMDFVVRWSVLGVLDECCVHFPLPEIEILTGAKACISKLQNDENALVKAEADFLSATVSYYEIMPTLEKAEKRKRSKAMSKAAPKMRFSHLRDAVGNGLHALQKTDFTMQELHEIVNVLSKA